MTLRTERPDRLSSRAMRRPARKALGDKGRRLAVNLTGVVVIFAGWEAVVRLGLVNALLTGSPSGILRAGRAAVVDPVFWANLGHSAFEFVVGVAVGFAIGVTVGLAAGTVKRVNYLVDPWINILYSTPKVALIPLIIIALGIDLFAKTTIIVLFAVFPVVVNTIAGVHTTPERYLRVARQFGKSRWATLWSVVVPSAFPFILTGLRLGGGRALVGVVAADLMSGASGIGYLMRVAGSTFQTDTLMFLILVLGMGGVAFTKAVRSAENRLASWRPVPQ